MTTFDALVAAHADIAIWCDGACHPNPGGFGGWAAVLHVGGTRWELVGAEHDTTNNRMEMVAALRALEALKTPNRQVTITSDSSYLVNGFKLGWLEKWKRNGRLNIMATRQEPVANVDLWIALDAATKRHRVTWVHVRGHSGNVENEACDVLAVIARKALRDSMIKTRGGIMPRIQSRRLPDDPVECAAAVLEGVTEGPWIFTGIGNWAGFDVTSQAEDIAHEDRVIADKRETIKRGAQKAGLRAEDAQFIAVARDLVPELMEIVISLCAAGETFFASDSSNLGESLVALRLALVKAGAKLP